MSNDPNDLNDFYSYMGGSDGGDNTSQPVGNVMPEPTTPGTTALGPGPEVTLPSINDLYNPIHDAIAGISGRGNKPLDPNNPPSGATVVGGGTSSSSGSTALNMDTFDQMQTKGQKGIKADLSRLKNETNAEFAPLAENAMAAADNQRAAANKTADAVIAKNDESARLELEYADRMKKNALEDEKDYALAQVKTQAYMADYEKSIIQLSTMGVDPGRAYTNLSGNARAGIKMTAFITDFLGAKGIKTSGMDYINRGIDMDIQAQKDAISLQKDVAQGKQSLWQMQRQQSESDYEATVRTRGALLNAFKTEIAGKLAAFDSPIARAKAGEANALVDQELVKTMNTLKGLADNSFQAKANNAVAMRNTDAQVSMEGKRLAQADRWRKEDKAAAAAAGPDVTELKKSVVRDDEGNTVGIARRPEDAATFQNKLDGAMEFTRAINELQKELRDSGVVNAGMFNKMTGGFKEGKYKSKYTKIVAAYVKSQTGAAHSDKEYAVLSNYIPEATLTTALFDNERGDDVVSRIYGIVGGETYDTILRNAKSNLSPITDPATLEALRGGISPGAFNEQDAIATDSRANAVREPSPTADVDSVIGDAQQWGRDRPEFAEKGTTVYDHAVEFFDQQDRNLIATDSGAAVPVYFSKMDELVNIVNSPSESNTNKTRAIEFLTNKANPRQGVDYVIKPDADVLEEQAAAQYFLMQIKNTPNAKLRTTQNLKR